MIPIRIHWSFWILIVVAFILKGVVGIGFLFAAFACVILHEFGHIYAAHRFGIPSHCIIVTAIGCIAALDDIPEDPKKELIIALAGPAVNVILASLFFSLSILGVNHELVLKVLGGLLIINLAIVVFNLIPAFPMDGGRVLRASLATVMPYTRATKVACYIAQTLAVVFICAGIVLLHIGLPLIGLFVFFAARNERLRLEHGTLPLS